jgi:hypothetical protein
VQFSIRLGYFGEIFEWGWIGRRAKIVTKYGLVEQEKTERERLGGVSCSTIN